MKLKFIFWSLLCFFCVTALAKSSHAKPSKAAPVPVAPAPPVAPVAPVLPAPVVAAPVAKVLNPGNFLALHSGYGVHSSSLTGTGFNSDLSGAMGLIYGAEFSHLSETGIQFRIKYDKATADQEAPAGITPTNITVTREEFRFLASVSAWESGEPDILRLGAGYSFIQNGATDTLPNNVLTKQSSQGLILNATSLYKFNPLWSLESEVLIYLPHKVQESPQVTGYNPNFVGAEIKFAVDYVFSEQLVGFIGASYRLDQVSYEGTVDRGVTNGQDSRTLLAFPVGLKIGY